MDIVSRLKSFMDHQDIASSQFADTCRIPRPTLSQLLNGRNKKISDELISKIHAAYPNLSVLWLMFGEGDMLTGANTQFSAAQNNLFGSQNHDSAPNSQTISFMDVEVADDSHSFADNFGGSNKSQNTSREAKSVTQEQPKSTPIGGVTPHPIALGSDDGSISLNPDASKRITRILVFYSDNSFQEFNPVRD